MEDISGLLSGFGNTDDIPALIATFATVLTRIIEMVKDFFASIGYGTATPSDAATEASSVA